MLDKILIANRGEIACRVLRTCKRLGISTVAIYSDADEQAPHVKMADEAVRVGPPPVKESYLNAAEVLLAAKKTGARAIHPGYGLLSEKASFAIAAREAGLVFIGPTPAVLDAFGDKIKARAVARAAGVHPPPGTDGPIDATHTELIAKEAERIGYPLLVKAAGGGGGIGMQIVTDPQKLGRAVTACSDRGKNAFADDRVYMERYIENPKHIEVQVLCDEHKNGVALGERECSAQRRHQKILEESPSAAPFFAGAEGEKRRRKLWDDALRIVESVGYTGVGTVEFVAAEDGTLYFLEVNARLQVEHCVTEMCTGIDLVEQQIRVASGEVLASGILSPVRTGASIEARIYAEDPAKKFAPQPGHLAKVIWPTAGDDLRIETGIAEGQEVTPFYDPLIAKIVSHGGTRAEAQARLLEALANTTIELVGAAGKAQTNLLFLQKLLMSSAFLDGTYTTTFAERLAKAG